VSASQSRTVPSSPAEASNRPSGANASATTWRAWPRARQTLRGKLRELGVSVVRTVEGGDEED
jgi:hypothetical protein